jgi:hypothetical protein
MTLNNTSAIRVYNPDLNSNCASKIIVNSSTQSHAWLLVNRILLRHREGLAICTIGFDKNGLTINGTVTV